MNRRDDRPWRAAEMHAALERARTRPGATRDQFDQFEWDNAHPLMGMDVRCSWCRDERVQCAVCWIAGWQFRPAMTAAMTAAMMKRERAS